MFSVTKVTTQLNLINYQVEIFCTISVISLGKLGFDTPHMLQQWKINKSPPTAGKD